MAFRDILKKLMCCCVDSPRANVLKKRLKEHKYCGCKESSKQRSKMQTCDVDRRTLVDNEVVEALEYQFQAEDQDVEECQIEEPCPPRRTVGAKSPIAPTLVPFNHVLRAPLHPQSDITVQGALEENAIRFSVNFVVARDSSDDIAFHFNPRLDQQYSARNSLLYGKWGQEEGNSQTKFPFQRGKPFLIEFFLTHSEFLVAVNGTHYCSYTYRTSLLNVTALQVYGGINIVRVHITNTSRYPNPLPHGFPPSPYKFAVKVPGVTENASQLTPVYGHLKGRLKEKSTIEINGRVKLLPISFYINLQEGSQVWPHPEVPLHVSVRFSQGGAEQLVLANAWLDGGWGVEDLSKQEFLFTPGYTFTMTIEVQKDAFIVRLGEKIILTFNHRVPYSIVDTVHIQGDVFIYDVILTL